MRFLGIGETCDLGSLYQRLLAEGHSVKVAVSDPLAQGTMAGLVPRVEDWREHLAWVREAGAGGVVLFEATGFGELQDEMRRDGLNVIGGSALGDRLENDRALGQRLLSEAGLQVAPTVEFKSADEAINDLATRPRRVVFKLNASAGDTFVGSLADGRDVAALLTVSPPDPGTTFVLMDHIEGIEVGIGAYFNGQRFLRPACIDWEHKRFFAGDMGELTGEMGTVATFESSDALFEATLHPIEPLLRGAGHVGYVNLNTIINKRGIWPLEFTCRFGYPGFAVLEPLQPRWSQVFRLMLDPASERMDCLPGVSLAVVLSTPPFPWSRKELDCAVGLPVIVGEVDPANLHLGEVGLSAGQLVTSGLYGWTAVVTAVAPTIAEAQREAYARAAQVTAPNMRYRLDIGDKLRGGELERLAEWGWVNSMFSRMASQIVR